MRRATPRGIQPGDEARAMLGCGDVHVVRKYIVACKTWRESARELLRVQLDIAVHAFSETVVDRTRHAVERWVSGDGAGVGETGGEVVLDAVAPKPAPHLAARAQESERDAGAVVFQLHVGQRVGRSLDVVSPDVRHAVRCTPNLDMAHNVAGRAPVPM